jgi:hypothetical protein
MTIVWIGWRQARWEKVWMSRVTLFFSQEGGALGSVLGAPRKREGRKEEPSILIEGIQEANVYKAIDKPTAGLTCDGLLTICQGAQSALCSSIARCRPDVEAKKHGK